MSAGAEVEFAFLNSACERSPSSPRDPSWVYLPRLALTCAELVGRPLQGRSAASALGNETAFVAFPAELQKISHGRKDILGDALATEVIRSRCDEEVNCGAFFILRRTPEYFWRSPGRIVGATSARY
jgi:hypothetical protein